MRQGLIAIVLLLARPALASSCPSPLLLQGPTLPAAINPLGIAAADFDKDGKVDYAVPGMSPAVINVYFGNGDGTFRPAVGYALTSVDSGPAYLITRDFDGDTYPDLAALDTHLNNALVLMNKGDGTFELSTIGTGLTNLKSLEAGDFNGDGKQDIVMSGLQFGVAFGNGDGTFGTPQLFNAPWAYPVYATAVNVDHSGPDEIAALCRGAVDRTGLVLYNWVDSTFVANRVVDFPVESTDKLYAADLNGDGYGDLAAVNVYGAVRIFLNDRNGGFAPPVTYTVDNQPQGLVASDVDGDGDLDLVFGTTNGNPPVVPIMYGNGDGTFQPPFIRPMHMEGAPSLWMVNIATGDIDSNGRPDFLLADSLNNVVLTVLTYCPNKKTTTTVTSTGSPALHYELVIFTAKSTAEDGMPMTGTMYWFDGGRYVLRSPSFDPSHGSTLMMYPEPGDHVITARFESTADYQSSSATLTQTVVTVPFGPPQKLNAFRDPDGEAEISWIPTEESSSFEIWRMAGGFWSRIGSTSDHWYSDPTADRAHGYFYKVRAARKNTSPMVFSSFTAPDAAVVEAIDPMPGDLISAAYIQKLRNGVDQLRSAAGLAPFGWTDAVLLGQPVRKIHLNELQTALDDAMFAAGGTPWPFDGVIAGVTPVRASDFSLIGRLMR